MKSNSRGSNFIGVSKNTDKWQVYVYDGVRKRYVGTFPNEKDAARAHDFFSICIHKQKAKTNFSYTKEEVSKLVDKFVNYYKGGNNSNLMSD